MNKAIRRFIVYCAAAVFVLLAVLLAVINVISFARAGEDADRITQMIADQGGALRGETPGQSDFKLDRERFGPMGPDSPDVISSVRYFTFKIRSDGTEELVAFRMNAVSESEAIEWAKSLSREKTGWTHGTYRYRVYSIAKELYVTVADQGRELLPSYRILMISIVGGAICLAFSVITLIFAAKKLFAPIEASDRRQRNFIAAAEREFKLPITVIDANADLIERESGVTERTAAIHRQTRKMSELIDSLGAFADLESGEGQKNVCDLTLLLETALDSRRDDFAARRIAVDRDIDSGVTVEADRAAMDGVVRELVSNAAKFALSRASFTLKKKNDRVILTASNDADLSGEGVEQAFDRFARLENSEGSEGAGLGLAYVKDAVKANSGRVGAQFTDGVFTVRVDL